MPVSQHTLMEWMHWHRIVHIDSTAGFISLRGIAEGHGESDTAANGHSTGSLWSRGASFVRFGST